MIYKHTTLGFWLKVVSYLLYDNWYLIGGEFL